jgi:hypothetical protein
MELILRRRFLGEEYTIGSLYLSSSPSLQGRGRTRNKRVRDGSKNGHRNRLATNGSGKGFAKYCPSSSFMGKRRVCDIIIGIFCVPITKSGMMF